MHKLLNKIVLVILSVAMCITSCIPAFAETSDNGGNSSSVGSDYTVTGTNSFINMMANVVNAEMEEQEKNNKSTVEFQTLCDSTIVVGFYEEDETTIVTTGRANATADDETAEITFTEDLPKYCYIKAYLINSDNMRPLGTVYECLRQKHMVTFSVKDEKHPVSGAVVTVNGHSMPSDSNGKTPAIYPTNGTYTVRFTCNGCKKDSIKNTVQNNAVNNKLIQNCKYQTLDTEDPDIPAVSQKSDKVSLGYYHSAAITENGDLYTCGRNGYG